MNITKRFFNWRALLILVLAAAVLVATRPVEGCGPFSLRQVFTYAKHPDLPLPKFAAGEIGVLQPTYARSYLVVAYRYFAGAPLDAAEQKAVTSVWDERLAQSFDSPGEDWQKTWLDARAKVATATKPGEISVFRSVEKKDLYFNYLNCTADSFKNAAATLNRLIEKYGAQSAEAKDWVATQDQVFANCDKEPKVIAPADASASTVVRANRAYQIAAANFYAGNFDQAESQFAAIAADASSPWRALAPYLVARTLIRKATLSGGRNEADRATLARAEAQLRKVLADRNESALHNSTRGLLSYVRLRLAPEERLKELSAGLLKKNAGAGFKQDVIDYTRLLDRLVGDDEDSDNQKTFAQLPATIHDDELSDWALTFQVQDAQALDHAVQKWEKTASVAWLVAALAKVNAAHPKAAALIEAGAKIKSSSPAFASVSYHTLRLSIEAGHQDAARRQLDMLFAASAATLPPSAFNQFMSLRMKVAVNLDEFLKYAQRVPSGFTYDEDGRELPAELTDDSGKPKTTARNKLSWDDDASRILNEAMPLAVLKEAATNTTLATHLRRELALAAWVRAALLDDDATATALTPTIATLAPELKELLNAYVAAADKPARKFAALYLILKYPGTRPSVDAGTGRTVTLDKIDDYRDNWWCEYGRKVDPDNPPVKRVEATTASPTFLTAAQKTTASSEWKRLVALGTAPNYLCAQMVKWASLNPDDPRAPEALHLAVRSTRYGCTNEQTGALSKQAYDLLHRKYPKSEWAQKTKYWFKG
ncbi:MAG: hypothetical protein ACJ74J_20210 [Blastocatellia bacterium]